VIHGVSLSDGGEIPAGNYAGRRTINDMSYKLPVGKVGTQCGGSCYLTRLHRVANALVNASETTIDEKRRILVALAMNSYSVYATEKTKELLYLDAIAPHIPDGHELTEREGEWGIWPIKAESPIITVPWPSWAEYAAMDENKKWYWFEEQPCMFNMVWKTEKHFTLLHPSEVPVFKGDWKDSLVKNPNK
jgi:hypothetical protein